MGFFKKGVPHYLYLSSGRIDKKSENTKTGVGEKVQTDPPGGPYAYRALNFALFGHFWGSPGTPPGGAPAQAE
jgi:hypothetical protein